MTLKEYLEPVCYKEFKDIENKSISDIIAYMHKNKSDVFYILQNNKPIYIITTTDLLNIFLENKLNQKIVDYITDNPKEIKFLQVSTNILDAYNFMRNYNIKHLPVIDENNNFLGQISFRIISLKISDFVIKDHLTELFNQRYFNVLVEEYNDFNKPLGLIFIELENVSILEDIYGVDFINDLIKTFASIIKKSVRDIDFVLRDDYIFKIMTFSDLEITDKIVKRIKNNLESFELNNIKPQYKIVISHVPELENNILSAIESCEKKLIKRD